ncbi:MAG: penicillin acylase family protein [Bacteroidetes bacterium]|nr:penicillin acylase family protein [Bacteroidota bacterium]
MKKALIIAASIFILISAFAVISYFVVNSYLPDYDGETNSTKISAAVNIYRDENAVPKIIAENEFDAIFALGYAHAQERLFQMDLSRRAGEGRLSEIFGSKTLPFDKMFRTVGIYEHVRSNYEKLSDISKYYLSAYCDGVNHFIQEKNGKHSVEFDLLGYDPYPWQPEHSLIIAKLMAWELNISWWTDIAFTHLLQKIGEEKLLEIIPDFDENAPTIIPDGIQKYASLPIDFINTDRAFREFMVYGGTHLGSNNWVVNKNHSASGSPIIANDPHLAFSAPAKWLTAVIISPEYSVSGFTLPGVPGVVIGKNDHISWVLTNVMADDADFFVEKFDSSRTKYFYDSKWHTLQIKSDTIKVKDSTSVIYEIRKTHRGPVVSDIHPYNVLFPNDIAANSDVSMSWTALTFSDELRGIISVNKSENWNQFENALEHFTVPGQNFVYGDWEGNIGYICAARLPIRKHNSPTLVYDGTTSAHDWKGFVPYSELPKLFNPSDGYIASANNKTVKSFEHHISNIWEPPSRIERITELLNSKEVHSVEDFQKYQSDINSPYAKKIIPFILNAFRDAEVKDENLDLALQMLGEWNFEMEMHSQTPAIYIVFYQYLLKNIFQDEMGEELFNEYIFIANVPYRVIPQLLESEYSKWFDDVNTEYHELKNDIVRKSLVDALGYLENKFGNNVADWQWKKLHTVTFKHPFSGVSPLLDKFFNVGPFELGGDGTTIFNTEYSFTKPYENKLGPSMRYIFDFAKPDEFLFILPTGQSGHFMSEHYDDMTQKWLNGEYLKVTTNKDEIAKNSKFLFTISPHK